MEWNDGLPDASAWPPRSDKAPALDNGLLLTCKAIQSRIVREAEIWKEKFNIDNYDSGLEDLVRRELSQLLADRYSVDVGVVNDQEGRTAGDYDVLIQNLIWATGSQAGGDTRFTSVPTTPSRASIPPSRSSRPSTLALV